VVVDHGDHVFWLGSGIAGSLATLRPSGRAVATTRRGINPERMVDFPIPINPLERRRGREEAKVAVGLDPSSTLLLSMAAAPKFTPMGDRTFMSLVSEVMVAAPESVLVVIGPDINGLGWSNLASTLPGRVHVIGPLPEPTSYLEAADIYLDSFPFSSLTSMYEAAMFATPVVSLARPEAGAMAADDAFLDLGLVTDAAAWVASVSELVAQPALRFERASELSETLRETHGSAAVMRAVETLYRKAGELDHPNGVKIGLPRLDAPDAYLATYQVAAGVGRTAPVLLAKYGLLPPYLG
jgi:hypothetical protein